MPITLQCPTHPGWSGAYPEDISAHMVEHPGLTTQQLNEHIERRYVDQATAQGRRAIRIVHCRSCGKEMTFTMGVDDIVERCEDCEGEAG